MPVIRGGDDHGVDVIAGADFAKIGVGVATLVGAVGHVFGVALLHRLSPGFAAVSTTAGVVPVVLTMHITHRDDLDFLFAEKVGQGSRAVSSQADDGEVDSLTGSGT